MTRKKAHLDHLAGFHLVGDQANDSRPRTPISLDNVRLGTNKPPPDGRPARFTDDDLTVEIELGVVEGRTEWIGVTVRTQAVEGPRHASALSTRRLRAIPFGALADEARRVRRQEVEPFASEPDIYLDADGGLRGSFDGGVAKLVMAQLDAPRVGRPRISVEDLKGAAETYLDALQSGSRHPTKDVARKFHLQRSTAAKWIRRARDVGLIPPYVRPEGVPRKGRRPTDRHQH